MTRHGTGFLNGLLLFGRAAHNASRKVAVLSTIVGLHLSAFSTAFAAPVSFVDVAPAAGVGKVTESYGASWADVDGDGFLDLFVSNHREAPSIYLNLGDGTFFETSSQVRTWINRPTADTHGGAFADFDNDGDQDLLISVGTGNPNQFLVNEQGAFIDRTTELGLEFDAVGGRLPVWLDYNDDGLLDFVLTQFGGAALVFEQTPTGFVETTTTVGVLCLRFQFGQLADINGDGTLDFICPDDETYPQRIYNPIPLPWQNITSQFPTIERTVDAFSADFNNDQRMDMFVISNGQLRPSSVLQADDFTIEASLSGGEKGFNFISDGPVVIDLDWNKFEDGFGLPKVLIGANEISPFEVPFTLDPADPNVAGLPASNPEEAPVMRIGFDPAEKRWTVIAQTENIFSEAYYVVTTTAPISDLNATGLWPGDEEGQPTLVMNRPGGFVEETAASGLDTDIQCASVTAGDYDNDMDIDLYLACRTGAENTENIYYDNQGNGTFVRVAGANGATGPLGANFSDGVGTADSAISGDYNLDGFLDLFVTNGLGLRPKNFGGPGNLYENQGNGNHWIQLDLQGTASTRDPVGARVTATAGGVTQLRVYDGGYHRWSQEPARMHFGMASNTTADLTVAWPSGAVEFFEDVATDQLYRIVEGTGIAEPQTPSGAPLYSCGRPDFDPATEAGVFVWRDCLNDIWRVRFTAGGPWTEYEGNVVSLTPFPLVEAFGIEGNDVLDSTSDPQQIQYSLGVGNAGQDGFNIVLNENSATCFSVDAPQDATVFYGPLKTVRTGGFDIQTGESCNTNLPFINVEDLEIGEGAGQADFTLTLSPAAATTVSVEVATGSLSATAGEDYTGIAPTTIEFAPGETEKTVSIAITDDALSEGPESFSLNLSNPSGALLERNGALATISDNEVSACGEPDFDSSVDRGVFIWKDCSSNDWQLRFSGGGSSAVLVFEGSIVSGAPFTSVVPVSNESSDILDFVNDPLRINYALRVFDAGVDGVDFVPAQGASVCFDLDPGVGAPVFVGSSRTIVSPPFDLTTLGACTGLPPVVSANATSAAESSGQLDVELTLSAPSAQSITVQLQTEDQTALAGSDYTALPPATLSFNPGETEKTISIPLIDDAVAEGTETLLLRLSNPTNAVLGTFATQLTITDDEGSPCGEPSLDPSSEAGIFVWRQCGTNNWFVTIAAGGVFTRYTGDIVSTGVFQGVLGDGLESSDVLDAVTVPNSLRYEMTVAGGGRDSFAFITAEGTNTCFGADSPFESSVFVGTNKTPVQAPFDLETLGPCGGLLPALSIADTSVAENAGEAQLTVTLSEAAQDDVSVDIASSDGVATAGADFVQLEPATVVIPAGETSASINLVVLDDALAEGNEALSLTLSNPVNAIFAASSATITITDDELSPCGEPTFDAATEAGIFLWQDCETRTWSMRVTPGGVFSNFSGSIDSSAPFAAVIEQSIENSDVVDVSSNPAAITWSMNVSGGGRDGFDFVTAPVANTCFSATPAPGAQIFVGAERNLLTSPFDLDTLGSCNVTPGLSVIDTAAEEGAPLKFTVSLSKPAITAVTANYVSVELDAQSPADFTAAAGNIVIPAGASSAVIDIATVDDEAIESNELVGLAISSPTGAIIADATATGEIIDNDAATLSVNSVTIAESGGTLNFNVSLSTANLVPVTVDIATRDTSTSAGLDYVAISPTTLTFQPGQTSKTVSVTILEDSLVEGTEIFVLELSNASGANIETAIGVATITDNEAPPVVSIADTSGNESSGSLAFTIALSYASAQPVSVDYATVNETATGGVDFSSSEPTTLIFAPGQVNKTIFVGLIDDTDIEPDETFRVQLSSLVGVVAGDISGRGTILDDEGIPTITVEDISVREDDGTAVFTALLSAASTLPVSVDISTTNGTATAPDDYAALNQTLVFQPGVTSRDIAVTLVDDLDLEFTEFLTISLTDPVNANLGTTIASAAIEDDEALVCGEPPIDQANESVVAVWQDCDTGRWSVRMTAGGGFKSYPGSIVSNQGFSNISTVSLEGSDLLETVTDPSSIIFRFQLSPPGIDGIDFDVSPDATVCFNVNQPPGSVVIAGAARTPVNSSFDLRTLGPCQNLPLITAEDIDVLETDNAASFVLELSAPSALPVSADFAVVGGTATAGQDFTAIAPGTVVFAPGETVKQIDVPLSNDSEVELDEEFTLELTYAVNASFGVGRIAESVVATIDDDEISATFEISDRTVSEAAGAIQYAVNLSNATTVEASVTLTAVDESASNGQDLLVFTPTVVTFQPGETEQTVLLGVIDDNLAEGPETLRFELSNPQGLFIGQSIATLTINDNEANPCGEPNYDPNVRAAYVWKDCETDVWSARFLSGEQFYTFTGRVSSTAPLATVTPVSVEATDTLDTSNPAALGYTLLIGAGFVDGFDLEFAPGAQNCIGVQDPVDLPIFLGAFKLPVTQPFNTADLSTCTP